MVGQPKLAPAGVVQRCLSKKKLSAWKIEQESIIWAEVTLGDKDIDREEPNAVLEEDKTNEEIPKHSCYQFCSTYKLCVKWMAAVHDTMHTHPGSHVVKCVIELHVCSWIVCIIFWRNNRHYFSCSRSNRMDRRRRDRFSLSYPIQIVDNHADLIEWLLFFTFCSLTGEIFNLANRW